MILKKKVLLVSPYTYSLSSRGMDVLTNCFDEEGWDVDHLTYPLTFLSPKVLPPAKSSVSCIYAEKTYFPYIDRLMHWIPASAFRFIKYLNNKKAKSVAFGSYDFIVLESGKPLFLMDLIPEDIPIIYRLSDSVQLVLGKNREYRNLERLIFERSTRMIFKKSIYKDFLENHQKSKTVVIENGMVIPDDISKENPFPAGSRNAVYVGLHQLDFNTVKQLLKTHTRCRFHFAGPCLRKDQISRLKKYENFHYYPFLTKEEYMPMLSKADVALFPFKRSENMKWFGLTSKFLHFMYFELPIISFPTGFEGEFDGLPVKFADSRDSFVKQTGEVLENPIRICYNLDFQYYSSESRKQEYKKFIRTL